MTRPLAHRGAALLLALAALSAVSLVGAAALRTTATARVHADIALDRARARFLARDLETALLTWLEASGAAAAGENGSLSDLPDWDAIAQIRYSNLRVEIRAVDLSGRLRSDQLHTRAARGLPSWLAEFEATDTKDILTAPVTLGQLTGFRAEWMMLRVTDIAESLSETGAAWLTGYGSGELNVRTAPIELLEAALAGRDPVAARRILAARRAGEPVPADALAALLRGERNVRAGGGTVRRVGLTATSSAMGFLLTIRRTDAPAFSWWLVAEKGDPRGTRIATARELAPDAWRIVSREEAAL